MCSFFSERIKVLLMTRDQKTSPAAVIRDLMSHPIQPTALRSHRVVQTSAQGTSVHRTSLEKSSLFRYVFRGFGPLFVRQILSWVSFLGADAKCKEFVRHRTKKDELSLISLCFISVVGKSIQSIFIIWLQLVRSIQLSLCPLMPLKLRCSRAHPHLGHIASIIAIHP